jgi:DNA-binding LacI/PurR family transcriptional regulator
MEIASKEVAFSQHVVGDYLVIATGVRPNNEMRAELEASGIPFVAVGDCYEPGDFMTCLRDGWMVGASIGKYALRAK